jgi:tripartite-type tricarboxylate transporter receptor subunit TctC
MNEVRVIALLAVSMIFASPIRAQDKPQQGTSDWPTRPLHFIVPFPAGGSTDVGARVIANHLTRSLAQQIVYPIKTAFRASSQRTFD